MLIPLGKLSSLGAWKDSFHIPGTWAFQHFKYQMLVAEQDLGMVLSTVLTQDTSISCVDTAVASYLISMLAF